MCVCTFNIQLIDFHSQIIYQRINLIFWMKEQISDFGGVFFIGFFMHLWCPNSRSRVNSNGQYCVECSVNGHMQFSHLVNACVNICTIDNVCNTIWCMHPMPPYHHHINNVNYYYCHQCKQILRNALSNAFVVNIRCSWLCVCAAH